MNRTLTRGVLRTAVATLTITLAGCGSDDPAGSSATPDAGSAAPESSVVPASAEPFGESCAAVFPEGPGSFAGMGADPVATAAGTTPALSALTQAVQAASLVETLNTTDDITVLAPVNGAFDAVPPEVLGPLLADTAQLTAVLTHHVIPGRLAPEELAGTHITASNDQVTIAGSGQDFAIAAEATVPGQAEASVICGNLQTANATVYLIDQVLAPTA
ncbi:fasciclin domain-containing protein [Blastococcus sp. SYSU DS0619]